MPNQFTPRPSDIPRPADDDLILTIMDMLLNQKQSVLDIANWLRFTSGYNYGKTYAYRLIKDTKNEIASIWEETAKNTVQNACATLYKQLSDAEKRNDFRLAFDIQKEINKITDLYKGLDDDDNFSIVVTKWGK